MRDYFHILYEMDAVGAVGLRLCKLACSSDVHGTIS